MAEVLAGIRSGILSHKTRVRGVVEVVEVARELGLIRTLSMGGNNCMYGRLRSGATAAGKS